MHQLGEFHGSCLLVPETILETDGVAVLYSLLLRRFRVHGYVIRIRIKGSRSVYVRVMRRETVGHERIALRDNEEVVFGIRGQLGVNNRWEIGSHAGEIVPVQIKAYALSSLP